MNDYEHYNEYDNSRPLDVHVWSDHPFLLQISKTIWKDIYPDHEYNRGTREKERFKHLRVALVDLYKSYIEDPQQYIGYSRNKNSYRKDSRYNDLHISFKPLLRVIDGLVEHGYLINKKGVHALHRSSRIRPTEKLINIFHAHPESLISTIQRIQEELLIMKGFKDKKSKTAMKIEYVDDETTEIWKTNLKNYNLLLSLSDISLDRTACIKHDKSYIDMTAKRVTRKFNDESWDYGGRFYGGWWQQIKSENRRNIIIDGLPTVEVDFRAFHILLLYGFVKGIDYFEGVKSYEKDKHDPYIIDEYPSDDIHRSFFKTILLICLNTKKEGNAITAVKSKIRKEVKKKRKFLPDDIDYETGVKKAIQHFTKKHYRISEYFYSNVGKRLQMFESEIAETIINKFTGMSVPILCIHDSFICQSIHEDLLVNMLQDTFVDFNLGLDVKVLVKIIR